MDDDLRRSLPGSLGLAPEEHRLLFGCASTGIADLLTLTHDCLIVRDNRIGIILWNRAAERLYGWNQSEARGQMPEALLKTRFPKPVSEIRMELETKGRWEGELTHTTRSGRTVMVASRWSLQTDQGGQWRGVLQVERDLTEQRRLEAQVRLAQKELEQNAQQQLTELEAANEALLESHSRFQRMAEAIPDVVWLANPWRTSIIYVNPAYERLWGRSCQSLYADAHSWLEGVHPEDRSRLRQFFSTPSVEGGYEQSYRIVRPDCSVRWVLDRGYPVREGAGGSHRVVGIVRDVTERKELEKEILEISEREQRRLGQDLHDDLCQQLAGIEFLSKALQQQLKTPPQAGKAGEIARLVRAAINHTRQLARGLAPLELEAEGLMRGLQSLARRTSEVFSLDCQFEAQGVVLVRDVTVATHLYRIAQQAVANSIKHGKATNVTIILAARSPGGELIVQDNGAGFDYAGQLSSGLGLRLMRYRADLIGASFSIESRAGGRGTTIVCAFPLTAW
jgi:PAS domain S-box-containing protein